MDEFFQSEELDRTFANAEFYLATVTWGDSSEGLQIKLDGETSGSTKYYKILQTGREPPTVNDRVLVMKLSGTYVVLGKIGLPSNWWRQSTLSTSATQAQIISKVNSLINMLINVGICRSENS